MKAESMTIILCRYVFHTLVFTVHGLERTAYNPGNCIPTAHENLAKVSRRFFFPHTPLTKKKKKKAGWQDYHSVTTTCTFSVLELCSPHSVTTTCTFSVLELCSPHSVTTTCTFSVLELCSPHSVTTTC